MIKLYEASANKNRKESRGFCGKQQKVEDFFFQEFTNFEVYSEEGILLANVPFPDEVASFDNLKMCRDHVYFVDPYDQACVYQYRVVF